MLNLVGQKYGRLTVLQEGPRKNKARTWICQCQCGNIKNVRMSDLRSGKILSCGCLGKENRLKAVQEKNLQKIDNPSYKIDMVGKKYGRLLVIAFDQEKTKQHNKKDPNNKTAYWECLCECGNKISVDGRALRNNHTQSCGCLQKEIAKENVKKIQPLSISKTLIDLTNQNFGNLTALKRIEGKKGNVWLCKCKCGNEVFVKSNDLRSGHTQSCGCIGRSLGNAKINELLIQNHINFKREVSFQDLKDQKKLRFDFGIYDNQGNLIKLIEFDGRQHYDQSSIWHTEKLKLHDQMKTQYCKNHHIPLLRLSKIEDISLQAVI